MRGAGRVGTGAEAPVMWGFERGAEAPLFHGAAFGCGIARVLQKLDARGQECPRHTGGAATG